MSAHEFSDFQLPCTTPGKEDDWFIPERPILEPEEIETIRLKVEDWLLGQIVLYGRTESDAAKVEVEFTARIDARIAELKETRKEAMRQCYYDCPMSARLLCLDEGLKPKNLQHGIWGGYPESERRAIVSQIRERHKAEPNRNKLARAILSTERREALDSE